jgi:hypothetical protein
VSSSASVRDPVHQWGNAKEKPLVLPDPIIESVIAYVHWLFLCSRNAVTSKVAASIGFIPSDDAIGEHFPKLWRVIPR